MNKLSTFLITLTLLGFLAVPPCGRAGVVSSYFTPNGEGVIAWYFPGDGVGNTDYSVYRSGSLSGYWELLDIVRVPPEGLIYFFPIDKDQEFFKREIFAPPPPPPDPPPELP